MCALAAYWEWPKVWLCRISRIEYIAYIYSSVCVTVWEVCITGPLYWATEQSQPQLFPQQQISSPILQNYGCKVEWSKRSTRNDPHLILLEPWTQCSSQIKAKKCHIVWEGSKYRLSWPTASQLNISYGRAGAWMLISVWGWLYPLWLVSRANSIMFYCSRLLLQHLSP